MIPADPARLERLIGRVLVIGGRLSTAVLTVGLVLWLAVGPGGVGSVLLQLGLLLLMGTPVLRVVVSFAQFVRGRDWLFAATTLAVLLLLASTMLIALRSV